MGSVSQEGNVGNVNNRGAGDSIEVSPGHGFEVGDMVWGKVKSHPWWPGHVYSEEHATPSVRRSKRDGLLLVAFFGDSSYGWFDPSELIPFDSNYPDKSRQTNSRTFVKALEEAVDEVRRRTALGLSCMCRNNQNFRKTESHGFFAVDVVGYEPGAVYLIDAIQKARESFQTRLALDFVRELGLEPTEEHDDIDFIKNKATVMSYRRAVYEEFDETYDQAFGGDLVRPSPGSIKVSSPRKKPSKAPLSGRQVFGDTAKLNKPKDQDNYILKRRDTTHPKEETKMHQFQKVKEPAADVEDPIIATLKDSTMEDDGNISCLICKSPNVEKNDIPNSAPHKISVRASKRPPGELGSLEKENKRRKQSLISDGGASLMEEKKKKRKKESLQQMEELPRVLENLHAFALDPLYSSNNRKLPSNVQQVFLNFRSLVFQKCLNEATDSHSKSPLPVKPQVRPPKVWIKREEITAKKKKKKEITDLKNSKKVDEDSVVKLKKSGQEVGQRAAEPTILKMEFPPGESLPSISELKVKLGRYGKLDHDGTRVYWKTFTCLVVYRYKADAEVALKAVGGISNLFGNTDVKLSLKEVSDSEPPAKVSDHRPAVEVKPCLKKSCSEEGGRKKSRVKFNLTGEKSCQKGIILSTCSGVSSSTVQSTPPPPPLASAPPPWNSTHYSTPMAPPSLPVLVAPLPPPPPPNIDIAQQMVRLLRRCSDVVADVTGMLGYVPYHPL